MPETGAASAFADRWLGSAGLRLGLIVFFAALVLASAWWNDRQIRQHAHEMGVLRARLVFNMIQTTRSWIAGHGGAFGAESPELDALMRREGNLRVRLTSLKPINPANVPDAWERNTLNRFEQGEREVVEVHAAEGGRQFHYMAPLIVTQTCLQCHAQQGYRLGDVRGGLSVSQPADYVYGVVAAQRRTNIAIHLGAFLLLAGITWASLGSLRRHVRRVVAERDARQKLAEELADKVRQLESAQNELVQSEKMASLGRMVAGFAHEVNTPVGIGVGAASHALETLTAIDRLLDSDEVSEVELRMQLDTLREANSLTLSNLRRAADMVQSFKRTSVDQTSEQDRDFSLPELIEDVFRGLHNTFKRTGIRLVNRAQDGLNLHGPAGALVQILNNLLLNSYLHAFEEGAHAGEIVLSARRVADGSLHLDYVDDGAGMSAEVAARLFEPFFTTRRGKGGSGLGMYIVYNLVTRLGGGIHCESAPGRGTRFQVSFAPGQFRVVESRP
jgi:signal transduction histidine kinase